MELKITLTGDVPSKKNSRIVSARNGRIINIPSTSYKNWHKDASTQLKEQNIAPMPSACCVYIEMYPRTKRKADLTNKAESVMDLLVDNKILNDDNWYDVPHIVLTFGEVDKQNPRVEVLISEIL